MSEVLSELKEIENKLVNIEQEYWSIGLALENVREAIFHFDNI